MQQIKGQFTLEQANDLARFLQLSEPSEVIIYEGDMVSVDGFIKPDDLDFDFIIDEQHKFVESIIRNLMDKNSQIHYINNTKSAVLRNKLYIEEIEIDNNYSFHNMLRQLDANADDLLGTLEYEMLRSLLNQPLNDNSNMEELDMGEEEIVEPTKIYRLYSDSKIDNVVFDMLIDSLDNIRNSFVEEIYESTRIKPINELTGEERRDCLFPIKNYSNGIDDYVIYQIDLEKEKDKGPVLGKRNKD